MSAELVRGSCLCGTVTYEAEAPFLRFAHCHCSRCRRATGSAHASNLYAVPSRFRWTAGEDSVRRYDLPSARSFATTFCIQCGTPLPHHTRSGREMVIPAGSIDALPEMRPEGHIFFASRPAWSCLEGDCESFEAYWPGWGRELESSG